MQGEDETVSGAPAQPLPASSDSRSPAVAGQAPPAPFSAQHSESHSSSLPGSHLESHPGSVTAILNSTGTSRAQLDQVFALLYLELKPVARNLLARSAQQTLSPTAVVHEAYAKLIGSEQLSVSGRRHFFSLAARTMRQVVADYARERMADKRGGGQLRVELTEDGLIDLERPESLVAMDDALRWLEQHDPRLVELIHLRVYVGLELDVIAPMLEVTTRQLQRDWQRARAWMTEALLYPDDAEPASG